MTLDSGHETHLPFPSVALCPGFRPLSRRHNIRMGTGAGPEYGGIEDTGGTLTSALDAFYESEEARAANWTLDEWCTI